MSDERESGGTERRSGARWLIRIGIALVALVGALVGGHWWWGRATEGRLDAVIARYRAAGEPMLPSDLAAPAVPDDQNAVIDLRAAAALINTKSAAWAAFDTLDPALPLTDREVAVLNGLIDERQDALAKVRQAAAKPGVDWQMQFPSPMLLNLDLRDLNQQRSLANLVAAAALYAHHGGDDAEAVRRIHELFFISRAVGQQPVLVSDLVSIGIAAMATKRVQQIAPDLRIGSASTSDAPGETPATPEQVQALLADLLDARGPTEDQKRAWRGERVSQLDAMRALVDGRMDPTTPGIAPKGQGGSNAVTGYLMRPLFLGDARLMADYMAGLITAADAPNLPEARAKQPTALLNEVQQHRTRHLLAAMLLPSLDRAQAVLYQHLAERRLAAVAVAARWYAVDHKGAMPTRLEDLVPRYLPSMPLDPLAAGEALRYRPGDDPIAYSVSQNGTDDGGSEKPTGKRRPPAEWDLEDRVLHLKRQPRPAPEPEEETSEPDGVAPNAAGPATGPSTHPAGPRPQGGP